MSSERAWLAAQEVTKSVVLGVDRRQLEAAGAEVFEDNEFVCSEASVGDLLSNRTEWKRAAEFLGLVGKFLPLFEIVA